MCVALTTAAHLTLDLLRNPKLDSPCGLRLLNHKWSVKLYSSVQTQSEQSWFRKNGDRFITCQGHDCELQWVPLLFVTDRDKNNLRYWYAVPPSGTLYPPPRLIYRCKVIIDHRKYQLFTSGFTIEPLMLTFKKYWLGDVDPKA